ncbi:MAG: TRAP transporter permease [Pseudomonadota bacterium]
MSNTTTAENTASAEDIVAQADTGARNLAGWQGRAIIWLCILWSLFQLYISSKVPTALAEATGMSFLANVVTQARYVHLAFALCLATFAFPLTKGAPRDRIPAYDWVLAVLGVGACLYLVAFRVEIADRPGLWTTTDITVSTIGIGVLLVSVYRSLGLPLVIIGTLFLALALFGGNFEWVRNATNYGGSSFSKAIGHYWMQTEGVFGVALGVSTTMIFLFVLFGALLEKAGGGNWFIKVAIALLGTLRGGPAKASVLSSAMTGMISGSSIANTVTTGTFTIPLMKRIGFPGTKAGAVEVASSTNGQLTPPVMGAAAFLMVEYVNIPYIDVVKHAFLPAVISYIALLYIVHLESLKLGLKGLEKPGRTITVPLIMLLFLTGFLAMAAITGLAIGLRLILEPIMPGASVYPAIALLGVVYVILVYVSSRFPDVEVDDPNAAVVTSPRLTPTLFGGLYFGLPIFVLVWNLMVSAGPLERLSPALSAFWATMAMIVVILTHKPLKQMFRGGSAFVAGIVDGWGDFTDGLISGARNMIGIGVATGAAGIIVGTISLTGAHQIIGQVIETIAGGNLMILLVLVAVLSLILGMGLPTTANYIVVSSLMAPVIVTVGAQSGLVVPLIAVHMFVFYFGILADDTPPVGLAAYAAAAISGDDPIKTGIQGFAYDIRTALLPFLFIFNTDLLLIDVTWFQGIYTFFFALIAMLCFAAATQGYFFAKSRIWETAVLLLIAFLLFRPDWWLDQVEPPYTPLNGPAAITAIGALPLNESVRIVIEGPDFDTGRITPVTLLTPLETEGAGEDRLNAAGLTVVPDGETLALDEPFPGTPYFERLANEYDFYGDTPVQIVRAEIANERLPKEIFFIPALLLLGMIIAVQSRRATQPAF